MAITATIYNALFKKTSTLFLTFIVGAFILESGIDKTAEYLYNEINRGKLWHHIKDNYKPKEE